MADNEKRPIIIKKIIADGHGGHHGGAWKVAYADFVTAMMAFFLLLWLLNAVPSEKLSGIAQYFEPTVGLSGQKGVGFQGGKAKNENGISNFDMNRGVRYGVISTGEIVQNPQKGTQITTEEEENQMFAFVEGELNKSLKSDPSTSAVADSVEMVNTPEGLVITIKDQDKYPMFVPGSAELQPYAKAVLGKLVKLIQYSPNYISIDGHTDTDNSHLNKDYSNWELSADRANNARRFMISQGMAVEQVRRVVAHADTEPVDANNPYSAQNRRIAIILLRNSVMPFTKVSLPK